MNYFLRGSQPVAPELPSFPESEYSKDAVQKSMTLEGLIAGDSSFPGNNGSGDSVEFNVGDVAMEAIRAASKDHDLVGKHIDVLDDEGFILIPKKELPEKWADTLNTVQLQSLDRSFLIPGEQIHVLVCLFASKYHAEFRGPPKAETVTLRRSKSDLDGIKTNDAAVAVNSCASANGDVNEHRDTSQTAQNNGKVLDAHIEEEVKTESANQIENHNQKVENVLERVKGSNYFVRVADSDEPLWSRKNNYLSSQGAHYINDDTNGTVGTNAYNIVSDKGFFDGMTSGGAARGSAKCYVLPNGDIVVVLQINVGVKHMRDPVLEILQFEKPTSNEKFTHGLFERHDDPCHELLNWLLPLDRTLPPPRSLLPPLNPSISHKQSFSSGPQIFPFGHFRSYSMPSMPSIPSSASSAPSLQPSNVRPAFELEDFENFTPQKINANADVVTEGDLSFRGVPLEPDRYSVRCGLEGVYLPGRRWRRKVEIVQPMKVDSFAAKCASENLLCVLVKNTAPSHLSEIIIYIDAITIVYAEDSKGGLPLSPPIAGIEVGNGNSLPNLALRIGEEHSFILKPARAIHRHKNSGDEAMPSNLKRTAASKPSSSRVTEQRNSPIADQYAVLVSYRCNYTESKLFFKKITSWRPCVATDLMISVSSEPYKQAIGPSARVPHLPVQVLTLEATNLTHEDLTLTVLAPETLSSSPSVLSFNSTVMPLGGYSEDLRSLMAKESGDRLTAGIKRMSSITGPNERNIGVSTSGNASGCTHLWLQSAVPLGCVPAHSSATVKLELLPLTDGIITLDTLQIAIKEKGVTYIPEHSLEIFATPSASATVL